MIIKARTGKGLPPDRHWMVISLLQQLQQPAGMMISGHAINSLCFTQLLQLFHHPGLLANVIHSAGLCLDHGQQNRQDQPSALWAPCSWN
jgi:hypothetical protein